MSDLMLDPDTGDLLLVDGDLVLTTGAVAVQQHLSQRLRSFAGEWFLDLDSGLPYYRDILVKNPNMQVVSNLLQEEIIKTPGVIELQAFSLTFVKASRSLKVSFSATLQDGFVLKFSDNLDIGA